jgi:hypothetical protein
MSSPDATRDDQDGISLKARAVSDSEPLLPCEDCGRIACNCPLCQHGWELTQAGNVCEKCSQRETVYKLAPGHAMPHGNAENPARYLHPTTGAALDCVQVCELVLAGGFGVYEVNTGKRDLIDTFSASAVVGLGKNVNEKNRAKLGNLPIWKAAEVAFKLYNKNKGA